MSISMLLLVLVSGCDLLDHQTVHHWGGWSTQYDADGVQAGQAVELLVRQEQNSGEHQVLEETWRFGDDGLERSTWVLDCHGSRVESRFADANGNVAILGDFLTGESYDWTSWHWVWTWVDGDRAGQYVIIDGVIEGDWVRMDKGWYDMADRPLYARTDELQIHAVEDWEAMLEEYGG